jgi:hypothetical protein
MKPNSRFLVAAALILVVPLSTVLLFSARGHTDSSLYRAAMRVLGPAVFLGGTFLMYPVAMIDAALFGGVFFRDSLFGFEPRDGYGWALYLVFYSILALSAGFAARSWPSRARAVRPVSVPARGAFEPSTSGALSGAAAVSPRSGRSVLGVPLRLFVGLLCALPVLWCAMPRRIDPTVGKNDSDGYPQECRGEKLYRFSFVQQPKPIERHKPVYSDKARNSRSKGWSPCDWRSILRRSLRAEDHRGCTLRWTLRSGGGANVALHSRDVQRHPRSRWVVPAFPYRFQRP